MNRVGLIVSSLLVALAIISSTLFVVDQRQFGVVYALGQIKDVVTEPGLHAKLPPPFQNVSYLDKRLLVLDSVDAERRNMKCLERDHSRRQSFAAPAQPHNEIAAVGRVVKEHAGLFPPRPRIGAEQGFQARAKIGDARIRIGHRTRWTDGCASAAAHA